MSDPSSESSAVQFSVRYEHSRIVDAQTDSPEVNHFLHLMKMSRSYNTWVNYALDLKVFFSVVQKPPELIDRRDCANFVAHQDEAGRSDTTINRRLAAVSSLFNELRLLDPQRFPRNPVYPFPRGRVSHRRSQSLYRRQPQRVPDILTSDELQKLFQELPTWRDRTIMLLMWISCLRISEALAIRFQDIECSRRSITIRTSKGGAARMVFMDPCTFAALNRYLDDERRNLFPDVDEVFVAFKGVARGQPLTVNAVQKSLQYYAKRCQLLDLHAHRFRHTGITQLIQQGMSEPAIRAFVGHHHPLSLVPYLHLSDTFVEQEFARAHLGLYFVHELQLLPPGGNQ